VSNLDAAQFLNRSIQGNIAARGSLETNYYQLGSDIRQGGSSNYLLSYMTQMGGWAILDYGLHFARGMDRDDTLRLGYSSYLAGWALVNSGTPKSGYGYWFHGVDDDGAAGWGFNPAKYGSTWIPGDHLQARGLWPYDGEIDNGLSGALRAAATIVVDDPTFGLFAYGGTVHTRGSPLDIDLHDGLEQRLDLLELRHPLRIQLDRDGFVGSQRVEESAGIVRLKLTFESRDETEHNATLRIDGLVQGEYTVRNENGQAESIGITANTEWERPIHFARLGQATQLWIEGPMTGGKRR
jgi:hypothetical protein